MLTVASTTTQMLRGRIVAGGAVVLMASARERSSPLEDAPKMVALVRCSTWTPSARRVTGTEAQPAFGLRCWVPDASVKKMMSPSLCTAKAGNCCAVIDVHGVPLGSFGSCLCGLKQRRCVHAYPLGNDGLGAWGEAGEAPVGAPMGDVCIHQVGEVSRPGVEPLARDDLPPFLPFFVAAECWAFVLQGAHGCLIRPSAVRVAAVILNGYAFWVPVLAGECPLDSGHARQATAKCSREQLESDRVATRRGQGGDRKATVKRQGGDRKRQAGNRNAPGKLQQESKREATGR